MSRWHVEGRSDFAAEWGQTPMSISACQVFLADPLKFHLRHWWQVARSFFGWILPSSCLIRLSASLDRQLCLLLSSLGGEFVRGVSCLL